MARIPTGAELDRILYSSDTLSAQAARHSLYGMAGETDLRKVHILGGNTTVGETLSAAFLQENLITSTFSRYSQSTWEAKPGFDSTTEEYKAIMVGYNEYVDEFPELMTAQSPEELQYYTQRIDNEVYARLTMQQVGFFEGLMYYLPAGILSPENILPFATALRGVGLVTKGVRSLSAARNALARQGIGMGQNLGLSQVPKGVIRTALMKSGAMKAKLLPTMGLVGAEGGLAASVAEVVLDAQQGLRTDEEMIMGIVGGSVFGSILGVVPTMMSKGYRGAMQTVIGYEYLTDGINDANISYSRALVEELDRGDVDVVQVLKEVEEGIEGDATIKAQKAWDNAIQTVSGEVRGPILQLAGVKEGWMRNITRRLALMNPNIRLALSDSNRVKTLGDWLSANALMKTADGSIEAKGKFNRPSIESLLHLVELDALRQMKSITGDWHTYKKKGGKLSSDNFYELVGQFLRREDRGLDFEEVYPKNNIRDEGVRVYKGVQDLDRAELDHLRVATESAAKTARKFINSIRQLGLQTGAFSKTDFEDLMGNIDTYLMREWDVSKIKEDPAGFKKMLVNAVDNRVDARKTAKGLEIRAKRAEIRDLSEQIRIAKGQALNVESLELEKNQAILEVKHLDEQLLEIRPGDTDIVDTTYGKITGEENASIGNLQGGDSAARIKNFRERTLDVDDADIEDWLVSDVDFLIGKMIRQTLPDLMLSQYLGSGQVIKLVSLTEAQLRGLNTLHKQYQEAPSPEKAQEMVSLMGKLRNNLNKMNLMGAYRDAPMTTAKGGEGVEHIDVLSREMEEYLEVAPGDVEAGLQKISDLFDERMEIQKKFNSLRDKMLDQQKIINENRADLEELVKSRVTQKDYNASIAILKNSSSRQFFKDSFDEDFEELLQIEARQDPEMRNLDEAVERQQGLLSENEASARRIADEEGFNLTTDFAKGVQQLSGDEFTPQNIAKTLNIPLKDAVVIKSLADSVGLEPHHITKEVKKLLLDGVQSKNVETFLTNFALVIRKTLFNNDVPEFQRRGMSDEDVLAIAHWAGAAPKRHLAGSEDPDFRGWEPGSLEQAQIDWLKRQSDRALERERGGKTYPEDPVTDASPFLLAGKEESAFPGPPTLKENIPDKGQTHNWTKEADDKFRKALQLYLAEGKYPKGLPEKLKNVLKEVGAWLKEIYRDLTRLYTLPSKGIKPEAVVQIPDNIRAIFDQLFQRGDIPDRRSGPRSLATAEQTDFLSVIKRNYQEATDETFDNRGNKVTDKTSQRELERIKERVEFAKTQSESDYVLGAIDEIANQTHVDTRVDVSDVADKGYRVSLSPKKNNPIFLQMLEDKEGLIGDISDVSVSSSGSVRVRVSSRGRTVTAKVKRVEWVQDEAGKNTKVRSDQSLAVVMVGEKFKFVDIIELEKKKGSALLAALNDQSRFPATREQFEANVLENVKAKPEGWSDKRYAAFIARELEKDGPKKWEKTQKARQKIEKELDVVTQGIIKLEAAGPPTRLDRKVKNPNYPDQLLQRLEDTLFEEAPKGSPQLLQLTQGARSLVDEFRKGTGNPSLPSRQVAGEMSLREYDIGEIAKKKEIRLNEIRKGLKKKYNKVEQGMKYVFEDMVLEGGAVSGGKFPRLAKVMGEHLDNISLAGIRPIIEKAHKELKTLEIQNSINAKDSAIFQSVMKRNAFSRAVAKQTKEINKRDEKIFGISNRVSRRTDGEKGFFPKNYNYHGALRGALPEDFNVAIQSLNLSAHAVRRQAFSRNASLHHHFEVIDMEYEMKLKENPNLNRTKVIKDRDHEKDLILTMVNRVRNLDGLTAQGIDNFASKASRIARNYNYLRSMGSVVISSIPDVVMGISTAGMTHYARAFAKIMKQEWTERGAHRDELALLIWSGEAVLGKSRASAVFNIDAPFMKSSAPSAGERIDYTSSRMAERFGRLSGINFWNGMMKSVAAVAVQSRVLTIARKKLAGKRVSKSDQALLNFMGISDGVARDVARINGAIQGTADDFMGHTFYYSKSDQWNGSIAGLSASRVEHARTSFEAAIHTAVVNTILTPNIGVVPPSLTTWWGKMLAQFRTFQMQSAETIMFSGAQRMLAARDINQALVFTGLSTMGMFVYTLKEAMNGKDAIGDLDEDKIRQLIFNGLDRGGAMALPMEFNNVIHSLSGGYGPINNLMGVAPVASRYRERDLWGTISAPASALDDIQKLFFGTAIRSLNPNEEISKRDRSSMRRVLPYQNLWWLSLGLDVAPNLMDGGDYFSNHYKIQERVYGMFGGEPEATRQ